MASAVTMLGAQRFAQLDQAVVIDDRVGHGADVVAARRRRRQRCAGFGTAAVRRIVAVPPARILVGARREIAEQLGGGGDGGRAIGHHQAGDAAVPGEVGRAAQLVRGDPHPRVLGDGVRTVDEGVAVGGHHHEVGEAQQERGAGDRRAVDDEHRRDDARAVDQRLGDAAPRVEDIDALEDARTTEREHDHERQSFLARRDGRMLDVRRRARRQWCAAVCWRCRLGDLDPHHEALALGRLEASQLDRGDVVDDAAQRQGGDRHAAERSSVQLGAVDRCERVSASERAAISGLRGRGTQ